MATEVEKLTVSDLEKALGKTIMGKQRANFDKDIVENLKREGINYLVPMLADIVKGNKTLESNLSNLYASTLALDDYTGVSEKAKFIQAAMFDGLVVGINMQKGLKLDLFTANPKLVFGIDGGSKLSMAKIAEQNRANEVGGVRIDVEYTSDKEFQYKVTSIRKPNNLTLFNSETGEGNYVFIPYLYFVESMRLFEQLLSDGRILKVTQNFGNISKPRYVTTNPTTLAKYTDSEEFAKSLKPAFYPLKGFFYLPVLGAPSTTLGCTKIELTFLDKIEPVKGTRVPVEKAEDGVTTLVKETSAQAILVNLSETDIVAYQEFIESLPNRRNIIDKDDDTLPPPSRFTQYLHSLPKGEYAKALSKVPGLEEEVARKEGIFKGYESTPLEGLTAEEVAKMLQEGIYRFTIRKTNCEFSTMTLTNNVDCLKKLYGDNYFANYESIGARLRKLSSTLAERGKIEDGIIYLGDRESISSALEECGFDKGLDTTSRIMGYCNGISLEAQDAEDWGKDILLERLDGLLIPVDDSGKKEQKRVERTLNPNMVMSRGCFAVKTPSGVSDYYKNLDITKIISMARIG